MVTHKYREMTEEQRKQYKVCIQELNKLMDKTCDPNYTLVAVHNWRQDAMCNFGDMGWDPKVYNFIWIYVDGIIEALNWAIKINKP